MLATVDGREGFRQRASLQARRQWPGLAVWAYWNYIMYTATVSKGSLSPP